MWHVPQLSKSIDQAPSIHNGFMFFCGLAAHSLAAIISSSAITVMMSYWIGCKKCENSIQLESSSKISGYECSTRFTPSVMVVAVM